MTKTEYLELVKESEDDFYDIETVNRNLDKIDSMFGKLAWFWNCSNGKADTAKSVDAEGFRLFPGARIVIHFQWGNTAENITLNVNGTGALPVRYNGAAVPADCIRAGHMIEFVYYDDCWNVVGDLTQVQVEEINSKVNTISNTAANAYTQANNAYSKANTANNTANNAYNQANSAYNTARSLNTSLYDSDNTIIGKNVTAVGTHLTVLGYGANANGGASTALGCYTEIDGEFSVALSGHIKGNYVTALGYRSNAVTNSTAVGCNAYACNDSSVAMGYNSNASGVNSVALGYYAAANGSESAALGRAAKAGGNYSTAIGTGANASVDYSTVLGYGTNANSGGTALGYCANATMNDATSIGYNSNASSASVAVGSSANARGSAVAVGSGAKANPGCIAIGYDTNVSCVDSVAIGRNANASSNYSTAMGSWVKAGGNYSTAIGYGANASVSNSTAIGTNATASGVNSAALGQSAKANGSYSTAIGYYANASGNYSAAIGYYAKANNRSTAMGYYTNANDSSTAIGYYANASGNYSTALGYYAVVPNTKSNTIQLGNASSLSELSCRVSLTVTSDERDKADITEVGDGVLEFLSKIRAIRYVLNEREMYIDEENLSEKEKEKKSKYGLCTYDKEAHAEGAKKGSRMRIGVSAQGVQKALKEVFGDSGYVNLVNDNLFDIDQSKIPDGVENQLSVNYEGFIPLLIQAVNQIAARLGILEERITA